MQVGCQQGVTSLPIATCIRRCASHPTKAGRLMKGAEKKRPFCPIGSSSQILWHGELAIKRVHAVAVRHVARFILQTLVQLAVCDIQAQESTTYKHLMQSVVEKAPSLAPDSLQL
eukprot:947364-Pelagomonas_calceolata.AAC.4